MLRNELNDLNEQALREFLFPLINEIKLKSFNENFCIAGGSVSSLLIKGYLDKEQDVDIWFQDFKDLISVENYFNKYYKQLSETENSIHYSHPLVGVVNLIKINVGSPLEIIQKFDFGICAAAMDAEGRLFLGDTFLEDARNREIKFLPTIKQEISSGTFNWENYFARINKYLARGYNMNSEDLQFILTNFLRKNKSDQYERLEKAKTEPYDPYGRF